MWKKFVSLLTRCVALSLLAGCVTLVDKPSSVAWHACYQPIEDASAHDFLQKGLARLQQKNGNPDLPIKKVILRYTVKNEAAAGYDIAEHFSLTEIVDAKRGIFCIYLGVTPAHERFYYLLGHEIGHLLHPTKVDDAAEERFCNESSRQLCEQESRPFKAQWETRKWVRE